MLAFLGAHLLSIFQVFSARSSEQHQDLQADEAAKISGSDLVQDQTQGLPVRADGPVRDSKDYSWFNLIILSTAWSPVSTFQSKPEDRAANLGHIASHTSPKESQVAAQEVLAIEGTGNSEFRSTTQLQEHSVTKEDLMKAGIEKSERSSSWVALRQEHEVAIPNASRRIENSQVEFGSRSSEYIENSANAGVEHLESVVKPLSSTRSETSPVYSDTSRNIDIESQAGRLGPALVITSSAAATGCVLPSSTSNVGDSVAIEATPRGIIGDIESLQPNTTTERPRMPKIRPFKLFKIIFIAGAILGAGALSGVVRGLIDRGIKIHEYINNHTKTETTPSCKVSNGTVVCPRGTKFPFYADRTPLDQKHLEKLSDPRYSRSSGYIEQMIIHEDLIPFMNLWRSKPIHERLADYEALPFIRSSWRIYCYSVPGESLDEYDCIEEVFEKDGVHGGDVDFSTGCCADDYCKYAGNESWWYLARTGLEGINVGFEMVEVSEKGEDEEGGKDGDNQTNESSSDEAKR